MPKINLNMKEMRWATFLKLCKVSPLPRPSQEKTRIPESRSPSAEGVAECKYDCSHPQPFSLGRKEPELLFRLLGERAWVWVISEVHPSIQQRWRGAWGEGDSLHLGYIFILYGRLLLIFYGRLLLLHHEECNIVEYFLFADMLH
jgi:hypothetical protein